MWMMNNLWTEIWPKCLFLTFYSERKQQNSLKSLILESPVFCCEKKNPCAAFLCFFFSRFYPLSARVRVVFAVFVLSNERADSLIHESCLLHRFEKWQSGWRRRGVWNVWAASDNAWCMRFCWCSGWTERGPEERSFVPWFMLTLQCHINYSGTAQPGRNETLSEAGPIVIPQTWSTVCLPGWALIVLYFFSCQLLNIILQLF